MAESQTPHLVLARKWRPERFSELVGQEHVTRTLGEALKLPPFLEPHRKDIEQTLPSLDSKQVA